MQYTLPDNSPCNHWDNQRQIETCAINVTELYFLGKGKRERKRNDQLQWYSDEGVECAIVEALDVALSCRCIGEHAPIIVQANKFGLTNQIPFLEGEPEEVEKWVEDKDEEADNERGGEQVAQHPFIDFCAAGALFARFLNGECCHNSGYGAFNTVVSKL